jgi:hypothetical protein
MMHIFALAIFGLVFGLGASLVTNENRRQTVGLVLMGAPFLVLLAMILLK